MKMTKQKRFCRVLAAAFAAPKHAPALRALLAALAGSGQITQVRYSSRARVQRRGAIAFCAPCSALAQRSIAGLIDVYAGNATMPGSF